MVGQVSGSASGAKPWAWHPGGSGKAAPLERVIGKARATAHSSATGLCAQLFLFLPSAELRPWGRFSNGASETCQAKEGHLLGPPAEASGSRLGAPGQHSLVSWPGSCKHRGSKVKFQLRLVLAG